MQLHMHDPARRIAQCCIRPCEPDEKRRLGCGPNYGASFHPDGLEIGQQRPAALGTSTAQARRSSTASRHAGPACQTLRALCPGTFLNPFFSALLSALNVTTCQKGDPGYSVCLGFVPVCRPSGYACNPSTSTQQSIYITAYPVSVRTVVDKSMEIEILMQYYLFWQVLVPSRARTILTVCPPCVV